MTTNKEFVLETMREAGRASAASFRARAISDSLTGTEVIASESLCPEWRETDYTNVPAGSPVRYDDQIWLLLQPYDATVHTSPPPSARDRWGLAHTTDPAKAKPYVASLGTSGMYMAGEVCIYNDKVYRSKVNNNVWTPDGYPAGWEVV